MFNRKLVLEDGHEFYGVGFGCLDTRIAEVVFNTSVVGYQEILSDPANTNRIVCMTYPVIGSYGLTDEDYESKSITVSGVIVKEYNDLPSNFRYTHKLDEAMEESSVPGISGIDTREVTRLIRDNGIQKGIICDANLPLEECLKLIKDNKDEDILPNVSTKKVLHSRTTNPLYTIVTIDLGIRRSVLKMLNKLGCNVIVVPYNTPIESIYKYKPDAVLLSDGPFNPLIQFELIDTIKNLIGKLPIFGIGNSQNLIALSYNFKVCKEKVGHNGCNIPVKNLKTGKIEITTQNTLYSICEDSINNTTLQCTYKNVLDNVIAGLEDEVNKVCSISFNPTLNDCVELLKVIKKTRGEKDAKKNRH